MTEARLPSKDPVGDATRAIASLEARLQEKPDDLFARYTLAMNYKAVLRFVDAERCFRELMESKEPSPYGSMAKIELALEPERTEAERRAQKAGGFRWGLHRARRWMYVDSRGRLVMWALILFPLLFWGLVWWRLHR